MSNLIGFSTLAVMIIIQIIFFAYTFGKLNGKVTALDKRLNGYCQSSDKLEGRVGKLEGRK